MSESTQAFFSLPHIETSVKVRVLFAGKYIVDTKDARLVWTSKWYPHYYFKPEDVDWKQLVEVSKTQTSKTYDIVIGSRVAKSAVQEHTGGDLADLVSIKFDAVDAWFEEDEQIFVHPKDPYKRVDVLQSSRHVRVEVNGVEVANTTKPRLLFETFLPVRTYIPKTDCRVDLLRPSETTTACPYKGVANYHNIELPDGNLVKDVVWYYRTAQLECAEIRGFLAFYDEKVDVYVDGALQKRPGSA